MVRYEPTFNVTQVEGFEWNTLVFDADLGTVDQRTAIQGSRDDEILVVLLERVSRDDSPDSRRLPERAPRDMR